MYVKQLDMFIWLEAYQERLSSNIEQWVRNIHKESNSPDHRDYADILEFSRANEAYQAKQKRKQEWLRENAVEYATRKAIYYGVPTWDKLRVIIYERDQALCWVCREYVSWEFYELGHIVSRIYGGLDTPDNLVVMCCLCNRVNPEHETRVSAERWRIDGGWKEIARGAIRKFAETNEEDFNRLVEQYEREGEAMWG